MKRVFIKIKAVSFLRALCVIAFTVFLTIDPSNCLLWTKDAMSLALTSVAPALFPFFVCSELIIALNLAYHFSRFLNPIMRPVFNISGSGALAFVLGIISGYPVGAKTAASLVETGACTRKEGERLLAFCNNSGPLFILGAVGAGMLCDVNIGLLIYISHFLASITVGIVFGIADRLSGSNKASTGRSYLPLQAKIPDTRSFGEMVSDAVTHSISLVLTITGYIILFNILVNSLDSLGIIVGFGKLISPLLYYLNIPPDVIYPVFFGLFEPTSGAKAASSLYPLYPQLSLILISAIIGWAGFSVHMQVLGIIKKTGLSPRHYIAGKLFQAIISPIYTVMLIPYLPEKQALVFNSFGRLISMLPSNWVIAAFVCCYMCLSLCIILCLCAVGYVCKRLC